MWKFQTYKIGIIHHGGLGDSLVLSSYLREIREKIPHAHISIFTSPKNHDFWKNNPYVNGIFNSPSIYDLQDGSGTVNITTLDVKNFLGPITEEFFDIIINTNPFEDIYLAGLTSLTLKASRKVSYKQDKILYGNYNSNIFYDVLVDIPQVDNVTLYFKHLIEKTLQINISSPFDTEFYIKKYDAELCEEKFKHIFSKFPVIALHPTGSINYRCLSDDSINAITNLLSEKGYASLTFNSNITYKSPSSHEELGNLPLQHIAFLLGCSAGMICVDSGLKHLAATNSIPIIELSHIPECLKYLNGPRICDKIKFSGTEYWKPCRNDQEIITLYPKGNYQEDDIISARVVNAIDFSELERNLSIFECMRSAHSGSNVIEI